MLFHQHMGSSIIPYAEAAQRKETLAKPFDTKEQTLVQPFNIVHNILRQEPAVLTEPASYQTHRAFPFHTLQVSKPGSNKSTAKVQQTNGTCALTTVTHLLVLNLTTVWRWTDPTNNFLT
jgi:hypothetical protein